MLLDARKVWRSRIGRSLVLSVLCGLLAVQAIVFVPLLIQSRNQQVMGVVRAETARIEALLQSEPAQRAIDEINHRPLLLGMVILDCKGAVAAQSGFVDFDFQALRGPGQRLERGDGVASEEDREDMMR